MALTDEMRKQIAKDSGVKDPFAKGDKMAAAILGEMAALGLTGGLVGAGGKLVYRGIKGARAIAAARKAIASAKKAKQASSKTGRTPVKAERKSVQTERKSVQTERKPVKAERTPVKAERKPVKAERNPIKTKRQSTLSNQQASSKTKSGLTKAQKLAIAGGVVIGGAVAVDRATRKNTAVKADRKPVVGVGETGPDKSKSKPKASSSYQPANAGTKKGTQYQPANAGNKNRKSTVGTSPDKAKEGAAAKRTSITAGKNAGFGEKGNIFPSNAADRKRLMALYGGTGSKAAAAAARGTQGNLKKGKK